MNTLSLVCQRLAPDHLVLELDVFQPVFQLCRIRAFDHLVGRRKGQLERKPVEDGLGVEDAVVAYNLVVKADPFFFL